MFVQLPRRHGKPVLRQRKRTVEDRVCTTACLTSRDGSGKNVCRKRWCLRVAINFQYFELHSLFNIENSLKNDNVKTVVVMIPKYLSLNPGFFNYSVEFWSARNIKSGNLPPPMTLWSILPTCRSNENVKPWLIDKNNISSTYSHHLNEKIEVHIETQKGMIDCRLYLI